VIGTLLLTGIVALQQPARQACERAPHLLGSVIQTGTLQGSTTVIAIDTLVDRSGTVVAWVYLGDNGTQYVQPSEAISPSDAALLNVRKPAAHTLAPLYVRQPLPALPHTIRRACAVESTH
jgi:hypothetical protein